MVTVVADGIDLTNRIGEKRIVVPQLDSTRSWKDGRGVHPLCVEAQCLYTYFEDTENSVDSEVKWSEI